MFGRKTKVDVTQSLIKEETVSSPLVSAPSLSVEELDRLYQLKLVHTVPNPNTAQRIMSYFEERGIDPIDINTNWYIYGVRPPTSWKETSSMRADELIPLVYAFPLPYKAIKILRVFLNDFQLQGEHCNIIVASPNPHLGILPTNEQRNAVRADPMLIAVVKYQGKEYTYNMATWDLSLDLNESR